MKTVRVLPVAVAVAAMVFAAGAVGETAFIHFENLNRGDNVTGPGTVHPYLNIETTHGTDDPLVIESGYGVDGDPSLPFGFASPNDVLPFIPNNCLEDEGGNRVQLTSFPPGPAEPTAKGFSDVETRDTNTPQELKFTFMGRKVTRFSILMVDFGDFNSNPSGQPSIDHEVGLWAYTDPTADPHVLPEPTPVDTDILTYQTEAVINPRSSFNPDYGDLWITGDACSCSCNPQDEDPGHRHMTVESEDGIGVVYVLSHKGADPHVGFDSIEIDYAPFHPPVDIKPTSCPNPLNVGAGGVLPVAIVGTAEFDVTQINPETVRLAGVVPPIRWAFEDVTTPHQRDTSVVDPYDCTVAGPDGFMDLTLKFDKSAVAAALGDVNDRDVLVVPLTGELMDGAVFEGDDVVIILSKKPKHTPKMGSHKVNAHKGKK